MSMHFHIGQVQIRSMAASDSHVFDLVAVMMGLISYP